MKTSFRLFLLATAGLLTGSDAKRVKIQLDNGADNSALTLEERLALYAKWQDEVIEDMGEEKMITRYTNIPGLAANLDESEAQALMQANSLVKSIVDWQNYEKHDSESFPLTGIPDVHNSGFTGKGVVIGIIDDALDCSHPAFQDKLIASGDFADFDDNPCTSCQGASHGTAIPI